MEWPASDTLKAQYIATQECFEFTAALLAGLLRTDRADQQSLVSTLEASVRDFRGEARSLGPKVLQQFDDATAANAAYRERVDELMQQVVDGLRD